MKIVLLKIFLLISVIGAFGCAAKSGVPQTPQTPQTPQAQAIPDVPGVIKLECKAANQLGCRHQGRLYPWNAWVEAMGYDSLHYAVKDVIRSGNKATVLVVER